MILVVVNLHPTFLHAPRLMFDGKIRYGRSGINKPPDSNWLMEPRSYHISLIRQRGEGFVAKCIELPGCLSEGKTQAEALKNIQDAIKLYLKDVEAEAKEKKAKLVQVTV